jgi:hypothetical protein
VHVVRHGENVAGERADAIGPRVGDLPLGPLAQVFHLGQRAQQPVLGVGKVALQRRGRRGGRGGFRCGGRRVGRLGLIGRSGVLVVHDVRDISALPLKIKPGPAGP